MQDVREVPVSKSMGFAAGVVYVLNEQLSAGHALPLLDGLPSPPVMLGRIRSEMVAEQ